MPDTPTIFCEKLKEELPAMSFAPMPGDLGEKLQAHISQTAWNLWLKHQTMLINEYRLNMLEPKAREFLLEEMDKFLFGQGAALPEGYVPPSTKL